MKVLTRRQAFLGLVLLIGLCRTPPASAIGITGFLQNASPGSRAGIGFAVSVSLFTEILTLEGESGNWVWVLQADCRRRE